MKLPKLKCHKEQLDFIECDAPFTLYSGGRGSGKSTSSCIKAIKYAGMYPNSTGMLAAPTYKMVDELLIRPLLGMVRNLDLLANWQDSKKILTLINGSRILFRSCEEPDNLRGPNLSFFGIDEAVTIKRIEEVWRILVPTLREDGRSGHAWVTTTPGTKKNFLFKQFFVKNKNNDKYKTFSCRTENNRNLSKEFIDNVRSDYEGLGAFEKRELEGEWADNDSNLIKRDWINYYDHEPELIATVRAWDLAASLKTNADFTASVKLGVDSNNLFYLSNCTNEKMEWPNTKELLIKKAKEDGVETVILFEAVGMQLALYQDLKNDIQLSPFMINDYRPSTDKITRALPVITAMRDKKLRIKRDNEWNEDLVSSLLDFGPDAEHDDIMDAISCGYGYLANNRNPEITFI